MNNTAIELAKTQNIESFDNALRGVIRKGNNFATIDISCPVVLAGGKKNPMQGRVVQHTVGLRIEIATDSLINSYASRYNRDLVRNGYEASYEIKPHAYAVRFGKDTATMHHKANGTPYMRYFKSNNQSGAESYYTLDGERIAPELIEGLKENKAYIMPVTRNDSEGRDEVRAPSYRLVKIENINAIRANHEALSRDIWARAKA